MLGVVVSGTEIPARTDATSESAADGPDEFCCIKLN